MKYKSGYKYITAEQFIEQPREAREILLDWWQPEMHDLFTRDFGNNRDNYLTGMYKGCIQDLETKINTKKFRYIPLFTEGQPREFIEDKTDRKVIFYYMDTKDGYSLGTVDKSSPSNKPNWYECLGHNLLQAYWYVVCQIAKEEN